MRADSSSQTQPMLIKVGEFAHDFPASKLAWAPPTLSDQSLLATASFSVNLYSTATGTNSKLLGTLLIPQGLNLEQQICTGFDWSASNPFQLISSTNNKLCYVWDLTTMSLTQTILAHERSVNSIAI